MSKSESLSDLLKLYKDHYSVLKIKENQFKENSPDEVRKSLDKKKNCD